MLKPSRKLRPPLQDRSRRTVDRLLEALEALLQEREAVDITVDDITERAHVSVGAFYKRFSSKQDLLPLLLSRLQESSRVYLQETLQAEQWKGRGLADRIDALIELIANAQIRERRILAAFIAGRFSSTLQMTGEDVAAARDNMRLMGDWLLACRDEIRHDSPEMAVRIGLYLCLQSLQTALLFESLPPPITPEQIVSEAKRMLRRYLTGSP